MKLIKFKDALVQKRPDGRTILKLITQNLKFEFSSMQILYVVHPSNFKEDLPFHSKSYEALLFLDNAKWEINGQTFNLEKDDILIFEPRDIHGGLPVENEVRLWIFQNPAI